MSDVMVHPVLAELEQRAGASDQDRAAWLAERAQGVTATEIRDLFLRKLRSRELIDQKLGIRPNTFSGNQYTAWGNKREPIIAAWVEQRFGIRDEHRVFRAADNARFLASPDGLGVGFDGDLRVSEIKTGKDDLHPDLQPFADKGYFLQMQWSMRVTGARRCLYAWEQHDSDWRARGGEFVEPAPLDAEPRFEWIEYDAAVADALEAVAVKFLAELDAARAALEAGDGPVVDEELDTLAVNYLRYLGEEKQGAEAKKGAWADLHRLLGERGGDFSQESALARITYTAAVEGTSEVVDEEAAREADPKLWASVERAEKALAKKRELWAAHAAAFTKSVPSTKKAGLTVTSVKPPKEKSSRG